MAKLIGKKTKKRNYSIDDAVKIADIAERWGRVVINLVQLAGHGSFLTKKYTDLLEEMKPYREVFEPVVIKSNNELNKGKSIVAGYIRPYDFSIPE